MEAKQPDFDSHQGLKLHFDSQSHLTIILLFLTNFSHFQHWYFFFQIATTTESFLLWKMNEDQKTKFDEGKMSKA